MFCRNCGKYVLEDLTECPYCKSKDLVGSTTGGNNRNTSQKKTTLNYNSPQRANSYVPNTYDAPSGGFAFLSFLVPIVGIILFAVWHREQPLKASSCIKGAITSIVLSVVVSILCIMLVFALYGRYL